MTKLTLILTLNNPHDN